MMVIYRVTALPIHLLVLRINKQRMPSKRTSSRSLSEFTIKVPNRDEYTCSAITCKHRNKGFTIAFVYELKRARVDKARVTRGFKKKKDLPPVTDC